MNKQRISWYPGGRLAILAAVLLLGGCMHPMHTYDETLAFAREMRLLENTDIQRPLHYALAPRSTVYVAQTLPAIRVETDYETIAVASYRAFAPRFAAVWRGTGTQTFRLALESARDHNADYLVYPSLVIWDDDVGTWEELRNWWQKRDTRIQDELPSAATVTEEVRQQQLERRARAESELRRDDYYRYREANTESQVELWQVRGQMAQEKLTRLQIKMLKSGEELAEWTHQQARALTLWLRSRGYDELGRDQVGLRMIVAEARTGEIVDTALLKSQSGWLTFIGDTPVEVMQSALDQYAESLSPARSSDMAARNRFMEF